ncbi:6-carboxytetrahydropterin synthase [Salinicola socius]|uniref:6-carboxy-5,6,7,8-tetrahydropterin synthase n=1 Tax=Salinicola socius TaxID=404433 RepID=A0A1Q8SPE4_9GAMM|nr:6-carboxytetrahydropterin synthase [Salinicola socius]OLO03288.1 6-pyruvoyl tetrahydropterin synthase-related protein [Salinicola socius]
MTLFVNNLTNIDASIWSPQRGLSGASWHVDVELDGELAEDGMLLDFGEVKPWIKARLDAGLDHTLLVPTQAAGVKIEECSEGLHMATELPFPFELRAPRQGFTLFPWGEITAERLGAHLSTELSKRPPPRVEAIRIRLREELADGAIYSYSHGLKHHKGNCQRIAHGHRSHLRIWRNGQRDSELEGFWAQRLDNGYLVDEADIVGPRRQDDIMRVRYRSAQGQFQLHLPKARCHTLPAPTTVENIAAWLARQIALSTGAHIRVQAFEGIDKGALAESRGISAGDQGI